MLWIALFLPELPLQVSHRGLLPDLPLVVSDGRPQRPVVLAANGPAQEAGIRPGMAIAAAQALIQELIVQPRTPAKEQAAIHSLACWATQFTPTVTLEPTGVLLEVQASLRLFGGLAALWKRLASGSRTLGFQVAMSWAPTPLAAWLLANARAVDAEVRGCVDIAELAGPLDPLPVGLFAWNPEVVSALSRLGISSIGQCRRLPRDGLIRRFGALPVHDLDRAFGRLPDPRVSFVPPQWFYSKIELAAELDNLEWVKLPIQQLLAELEGYLRARLQGTQELMIRFEQGRQLHTDIKVSMSVPECFAENFALLVHEHLARIVLSAPIQAVSLRVDSLVTYCADNESLVPDGATQSLAWHQLCERLAVRLPKESLYRIAVNDDHRPEYAWAKDGEAKRNIEPPDLPRPAWLLAHPRKLLASSGQPHFHGPLTLLTAPERVEAGWWDNLTVSRDYYIARNPDGQVCWVYRDHVTGDWYLHGIFA